MGPIELVAIASKQLIAHVGKHDKWAYSIVEAVMVSLRNLALFVDLVIRHGFERFVNLIGILD